MIRPNARPFFLLALLAALPAVADPATQPMGQPAELPVKAVTLFSSGVGYFEHFGTVNGDGSTELRFKTDQINDILKSLVMEDLDGGHVSAVQYASQDPVDKTLKSFQVDLTGNPPMADLLNQLRGAKITLGVGTDGFRGTILGVEKRTQASPPPAAPVDSWFISLFQDNGVLRSIDLAKVGEIGLDDPVLKSEFARALAALASSRDQDKKPVNIHFTGRGERRIRLGYVVAAPVWKTSYRLILGDKDGKADANMQGWAVVENQTDNDWKNVELSLVSGRPISFQMNLYEPLYIERPTVVLDLFKNLRPQLYAGGMNENAGAVRHGMAARQLSKFGVAGAVQSGVNGNLSGEFAGDAKDSPEAAPSSTPMNMGDSVQPLAATMKMGELFHFTVADVSLPRLSSAMIPIVADAIGAERLSIYNRNVMPRNALSGVMLDNTTGKHLLQGPVTVYDAGGYAGDAEIDNLPPGQKRMLSYGVDLEMLIDAKPTSASTILTARVVKGVFSVSRKTVQSVKYEVQSKSDHDKTIVIEHPITGNWSLNDTPDPFEKTDQLYRFKLDVPKGETKALTVNEQTVGDQLTQLGGMDDSSMIYWSKSGEIPAKVRDALSQAIRLKQAMNELTAQVVQKKAELSAIDAEQGRLRENMKTVDKGSQYYNRLMTKLNDQETKIEKLQGERDDLQSKADAARESFDDFIGGLDVG